MAEGGERYSSLTVLFSAQIPSENSSPAASGFCCVSSIMYLDHVNEFSFTADTSQHAWSRLTQKDKREAIS